MQGVFNGGGGRGSLQRVETPKIFRCFLQSEGKEVEKNINERGCKYIEMFLPCIHVYTSSTSHTDKSHVI